MKCQLRVVRGAAVPSSPSRGTWIEIFPKLCGWISLISSSPSRGTWIEMPPAPFAAAAPAVVPLTGDVD